MRSFFKDWLSTLRDTPPMLIWLLIGSLCINGFMAIWVVAAFPYEYAPVTARAGHFAILTISAFMLVAATSMSVRRFYVSITTNLLGLPDLVPIRGGKSASYTLLFLLLHFIFGTVFIWLLATLLHYVYWFTAMALGQGDGYIPSWLRPFPFVYETRWLAALCVAGCLGVTALMPLLAAWIGKVQRRLASNPLFGELKKPLAEYPGLEHLSPREKDALLCLGQGMTNRQIAKELVISEETAKYHVASLLKKLDVENRTQAAVIAIRYELGHHVAQQAGH
jgi:DNA-binding CsgD family transcriptional regulator